MNSVRNSNSIAPPIAEAARIAQKLIAQIKQRRLRALLLAQRRMKALARLIACLPLGQDEYCYFINRVSSTGKLLVAGERGAAIYQLREMHRKLVRLIADRA